MNESQGQKFSLRKGFMFYLFIFILILLVFFPQAYLTQGLLHPMASLQGLVDKGVPTVMRVCAIVIVVAILIRFYTD